MKAIIFNKYGPPEVLVMAEVEKPVPKDHEVLIKVKATAVNSADCRIRRADPFLVRLVFGLFRPRKKILGLVLAGEIEDVGKKVSRYKTGDKIFGATELQFGANAEYACMKETDALALKPDTITFEEAASIPFGAHTALNFLQKAKIQPGQKVMIYGASGAVGTAAVQLAKHFGAHVTGVCSTTNLKLVKSLGADRVIDYTKEDVSRLPETWDVIFETVDKISTFQLARIVKKGGTLILGSAMLKGMLQGAWISMSGKAKVLMGSHKTTASDMIIFLDLLASGAIKPLIDRVYPLEEIVEAHRYVDAGHKKGNVVIKIN
ncbi:MAG: NAD(P)-dependent alcohol dehydrogenase [Bacteroidetes bacterium]|nr:MAG: NAD(P)-dependent alcohol dehydrogenase [Bacteroidota bacterium]